MKTLFSLLAACALALACAGCGKSAPSADVAEESHDTPLIRAAEKGDVGEVRRLLDAGENVNAYDGLGLVTPLMMAADKGHVEVVRLLLDRKADVNARDGAEGLTALDYAEVGEHPNPAVINMLSAAGGRHGVVLDEVEAERAESDEE